MNTSYPDAVESPLYGVICEKGVFNAVFTDAPYGICLMDMTGKFLDVNEACEHILGYSRSELIGMTFQSITIPEDVLYDSQMMNKVIRGEIEHYEMVKRFISKVGKLVWTKVDMRVIREDGKVRWILKHIVQQNGSASDHFPEMRIGELFRHPTTRCFMCSMVMLMTLNIALSLTGLLLHILKSH